MSRKQSGFLRDQADIRRAAQEASRQKLDDSLKPLCTQEPFIPFESRYEFLPDIVYGKRI